MHDFDFVCVKVDTGEKLILDSILNQAGNQDSLEVAMVKLRLKTYDCSPDSSIVSRGAVQCFAQGNGGTLQDLYIEATEESSPYEQLESILRTCAKMIRIDKSPLSDLV